MDRIDPAEVQTYLDANYLTLEELAARGGVSPERVCELVDAQCVPPHSHEVRGVTVFASTFGEYTAPSAPCRYYHPSVADWVRKAAALARTHSLAETARRLREAFEWDYTEALGGREPPWPSGVDHAWGYLMDGTWGLCLKEITAANLLAKEFARTKIASLVKPDPGHVLSPGARRELAAAIKQYDRVALDFGPHEFADSSRHREVNAAIDKYGLTGKSSRKRAAA